MNTRKILITTVAVLSAAGSIGVACAQSAKPMTPDGTNQSATDAARNANTSQPSSNMNRGTRGNMDRRSNDTSNRGVGTPGSGTTGAMGATDGTPVERAPRAARN